MTKITNTTASDVAARAMLVKLTINAWSGQKLDKTITAEVARQHDVSTDSGKYTKALVEKTSFEPITKATGAMRTYHYANTLPWMDDGARILPSANYFSYREEMARLKDIRDRAVQDFVDAYPRIINAAEIRLNGMFRRSDFPSDVGRLFGSRLGFLPFPDDQDFRVELVDGQADRLRASIAEDVAQASKAAVADCWNRIADVVGSMSERLGAYRINPTTDKVEGNFRSTLVTNIEELADLLPKLNFTNDPALDRVAAELKAKLCQYDADTLKGHESKRVETLAAADAILASMGGYLN